MSERSTDGDRYHPDDLAHLQAVLAKLRGLRLSQGRTLADVAAVLGVSEGAVSDVEIKPGQRLITSLQDFAHGLGYRALFRVRGLVLPDGAADTADMLQTLADRALAAGDWRRALAYDRSAFGARLRAHREAQGLTQQALGDRYGRNKGNIQLLEKLAHNPMLGTLQTLVRQGLGGVLEVRFALEDPAAAAARVGELLEELRDYVVVAGLRHQVTVAAGTLDGIGAHAAATAAERHAGRHSYAEVWLLRCGHEVRSPWRELPAPPYSS